MKKKSIIFVFPLLILITVTQVLSFLLRSQINVCDSVQYLLLLVCCMRVASGLRFQGCVRFAVLGLRQVCGLRFAVSGLRFQSFVRFAVSGLRF